MHVGVTVGAAAVKALDKVKAVIKQRFAEEVESILGEKNGRPE
ncbi:hypothetical protein ACIA8I_09175 [Streptomyces rishiriensis]